jgi:hypothetical protein
VPRAGNDVTAEHHPQSGAIEDRGYYGRVTFFEVPGGFTVQLYEPRYAKPSRGHA